RVHLEGAPERPGVLERVIAAGRHQLAAADVRTLSPANQRIEDARLPGRNRRPGDRPGVAAAPEDPGAARPEQPFVRACREEIAPEIDEGGLLDAEAVDAVDRQEYPAARVAAPVDAGHHVGDRSHRRLHTG